MSVPPRGPVVLYLLEHYPVLSQTFVRDEVASLRALGVDVRVLALKPGRAALVDSGWGGPFEVARPRGARASVAALAWCLRRHPRRTAALGLAVLRHRGALWSTAARVLPAVARQLDGEDVVAVHTHFAFRSAWAAHHLAVLLGCPSSVTVHAADIYVDTTAAARRLRAFDRVVQVCEHNRALLTHHGVQPARQHVVPCGVDVPPAGDLAPLPEVGRTRLLSVGRMVAKKGYPTLVAAMPAVLERVPGAHLDVIGAGPDEAAVRAQVEAAGLSSAVTLHGARPHAEALEAIATTDVFVLACTVPPDGDSDALPVVLREAMARRRPVVSTAVAGIPELLDDSCGWVVPPDDPAALADALVAALTDPAAGDRADEARERVAATATLERSARAMEALLLGRPPS